jgi:hypothetical protein
MNRHICQGAGGLDENIGHEFGGRFRACLIPRARKILGLPSPPAAGWRFHLMQVQDGSMTNIYISSIADDENKAKRIYAETVKQQR